MCNEFSSVYKAKSVCMASVPMQDVNGSLSPDTIVHI